jgi:phage terminase small subunit
VWFLSVLVDYVLEPHHIRLLTLAAEAWDRSQEARKQVAAEGLTFEDRYGSPHPHPAVNIERDARLSFARLMRELDLDAEPPSDTRIPRRGGRN